MDDDGFAQQEASDRRAIEAVEDQPLHDEWPNAAMRPGARVRVMKDESWDGPWREVFTGVVDATIAPRHIRNSRARADELEYSVRFDEPQFDAEGDGPYRKAVIWDRSLERY
ncbi:hypothetical protein [Agromyces sp. M3QZ16-3]|uniref:hypothetical protein n=1 Tax=Agromyces sp. M3QZ16-3 TaxID=3447585 RepID=UPI003F694B41